MNNLGIIIGFVTYMFFIVHIIPGHDQLTRFTYTWQTGIRMGRWLEFPLNIFLTGNYYVPWLYGCVGIFFQALVSCACVVFFDVKKYLTCFFIAALLITFPTYVTMLCYEYAMTYMTPMYFMTVLGAYFSIRQKYGFIYGAILFMLGAGCYQTAFCFALGLYVVYLILAILKEPSNVKATWICILRAVLSLAFGALLYLVFTDVISQATGITRTYGYIGNEQISKINLWSGVKKAVKYFLNIFYYNEPFSTEYVKYFYIILTAIAILIILVIILREKLWLRNKFSNLILIIFLILSLPVTLGSIYIATSSGIGFESVHLLMVYTYVLYPIGIAVLCENFGYLNINNALFSRVHTIVCYLSTCILFALSWNYCIALNQATTRNALVKDQALSYLNRLMIRLENLEGYNGQPFISYGAMAPEVNYNPLGDNVDSSLKSSAQAYLCNPGQISMHMLGPGINADPYFGYVLGEDALEKYPELNEMPVYPNEGSLRITNDGKVLAKFVETPK